ncbi:MAG: S8 family serine peptidase, partial [Clostridia bacterium]|nr:S8 family serine peptidase [Clostridia bacterium]
THPEMYDNIDTSLAYNVYANTTSVGDVSGHGTHIEGIIGAALDGYGTNGICKNVTIVPIKITNDVNNTSSLYYMGLGVQRATNMGAKVINLSFSMSTCNDTFKGYISSFGNLFVTSAGNNSIDIESDSANAGKVNDEPLWIVVGSMTSAITKSGFSNYNESYVDLFAPGSNILSLDLSNGYTLQSGTSMAAPMVAAAIALIASHATHLSPAEIKEYILDNCIQTNAFGNLCVSGGYLYLPSVIEQIYSENRGAYSRGDGNGDGYITSVDYAMCRRTVLGTYTPTPQQAAALDINGNGVVDSTDYAKISRYILRTFYFIP